jgi:dipeptidyl aminopeptidase/acylaminoacyl peptidase
MIRRAIAILATFSVATLAFAADEKIPIESFFKISEYASMNLSPDGTRIAALAPVAMGRQGLVIIDIGNRKATPIARFSDVDVVMVEWINNKRLFFRTGTLGERDADFRGGDLFAIDSDGSSRHVISRLSPLRLLPGETDDVIAQEFGRGGATPVAGNLVRLDTRTGRTTLLSLGKPDSAPSESWVVDRDGAARVFTASIPGLRKIYYRPGPDAPWQKLAEFEELAPGWTPVRVAEDNRTLYVSSRMRGDKSAIYRYDPETRTLGDLVAQHPQVDLGGFQEDKEGVRGIRYNADKPGVAWLDEGLASIQGLADRTFPGQVNDLSWSTDRNRFVIDSHSDVSPGSFYLYDRKSAKMEWLGDRRPWIDPKKMSPMQPVRYKARDGLEIPAYLTVPRDSSGKNLPLVVLVHGGPNVPGDSWGFQPEVQFLASRGYAVLQPNYRGTTRYGWKHFSSAFKQWGLTMQDDVTDGVAWAVAQGFADPKRVCIYGGSYGGYAAMMGVAKTPEVFKCAINYVGVTDLPLLLTATWSDTYYSEFATFSSKYRIGDLDKDLEQLKATSPTNLAARIKAPVMMAYGAADVRVVPEHGTFMKSALERAANPPEVWMMVDGEGHGFRRMENQVMFYGAMEKFLDKHIGH